MINTSLTNSNTVDLLGEVALLGYYQLSDISSKSGEVTDFPTLLDGRTGLFNNYGVHMIGLCNTKAHRPKASS